MTETDHLKQWLSTPERRAMINIRGIEKTCGLPENILKNWLQGSQGLAEHHLDNLVRMLQLLGYKPITNDHQFLQDMDNPVAGRLIEESIVIVNARGQYFRGTYAYDHHWVRETRRATGFATLDAAREIIQRIRQGEVVRIVTRIEPVDEYQALGGHRGAKPLTK